MEVTLKRITPNALEAIGEDAAICYDASTTPEANRKRAINCKSKGHLATYRFAHATFHIKGISRICSHQFVRSKHLDFLQQSQRYVNQEDCKFIRPPSFNSLPHNLQVRWMNHELEAKQLYKDCIAAGMKKEDARYILLEATETELNVVGNLQAWQDFINLRSGKEAQEEIRNLAHKIDTLIYQALEKKDEKD